MNMLDNFLNKITTYRMVVYVLSILVCLSIVFAFLGRLATTPTQIVLSLCLLIVSAYVVDRGFAMFFKMPANMESSLITALILFLIVQPADSLSSGIALLLAGGISSASKYLLTWNGKHIFNPAAFAAAFLSLTGLQATTWWIGGASFWPFTLVLGLLVVRKIRHSSLFITFVTVSVVLQYIMLTQIDQTLASGMKSVLLASPLIFLSTIMLTEPATMPPRRILQMLFAGLVAIFYVEAWTVGPFSTYPEVALLLGNVFAFAVSPKLRIAFRLSDVQRISENVYNYVFIPEHPLRFLPGQYLEWTLAGVPYDSRGNRRTFTIASSPTENEVHIGLKYYDPSSSFKATFRQLEIGDTVYASQLAGNFTLAGSEHKKLAFIAGGIGITPFRSMAKYLTDKDMPCDVIVLYFVSDPQEFAYNDIFDEAAKVGIKTVRIATDTNLDVPDMISAKLSTSLIKKVIPDFNDRAFYISGPNNFVDSSRNYLKELGVKKNSIRTDHFSGY